MKAKEVFIHEGGRLKLVTMKLLLGPWEIYIDDPTIESYFGV